MLPLQGASSREGFGKGAASYSPALHCSTIGASGLNCSVRNGKRWNTAAIATQRGLAHCTSQDAWVVIEIIDQRLPLSCHSTSIRDDEIHNFWCGGGWERKEAFGQLVALGFGVAAFTPVPYRRPRLERPWWGALILRPASHLDAFSAYPIQTRLPGGAPGGTTGRPEVCPSRSSRTSDRATQSSNAHDR